VLGDAAFSQLLAGSLMSYFDPQKHPFKLGDYKFDFTSAAGQQWVHDAFVAFADHPDAPEEYVGAGINARWVADLGNGRPSTRVLMDFTARQLGGDFAWVASNGAQLADGVYMAKPEFDKFMSYWSLKGPVDDKAGLPDAWTHKPLPGNLQFSAASMAADMASPPFLKYLRDRLCWTYMPTGSQWIAQDSFQNFLEDWMGRPLSDGEHRQYDRIWQSMPRGWLSDSIHSNSLPALLEHFRFLRDGGVVFQTSSPTSLLVPRLATPNAVAKKDVATLASRALKQVPGLTLPLATLIAQAVRSAHAGAPAAGVAAVVTVARQWLVHVKTVPAAQCMPTLERLLAQLRDRPALLDSLVTASASRQGLLWGNLVNSLRAALPAHDPAFLGRAPLPQPRQLRALPRNSHWRPLKQTAAAQAASGATATN